MNQLWEQIQGIWGNMTPGKRWATVSILTFVIAGFAWIITTQTGTQWKTVGRGLTQEDMQAGVKALEAKKIPVRLDDNGRLQVHEDKFDEARIELATASALTGGIGMELFNESTFGQSAFQEAINYHRAMEGELARTIRSINGVKGARVHLVIPKKRLFKKDRKPATASVKLNLKTGVELSDAQVKGIQHLVASAIEGLNRARVAIIDQSGRILARPNSGSGADGGALMEIQARFETQLEGRIVELLETVTGEGKIRAQVSAVMDFSKVEITEKDIDPEKQVLLSEDRTEETAHSADPKAGGVPGVAANVPGRVTAVAGSNATSRTARKESARYETANSIRRTELPVGRLTRISVAVAVDGKVAQGEDGAQSWVPRTDEEMSKYKELVSKAVGFDSKRGDQIAVVNTRFDLPEPAAVVEATGPSPWMKELLKWGLVLVLSLLLILGVVRPLTKAARSLPPRALVTAGGPPLTERDIEGTTQTVAAGQLPGGTPEGQSGESNKGERLRLRAIESTREDPKRAAQVIRAWLLVEE